MIQSSSKLPVPGRLFLPGCAIAAGLLAVSSPVFAAPTLKSGPKATGKSALVKAARLSAARKSAAQKFEAASKSAPLQGEDSMTMRVGKSVTYSLPKMTTVTVETGGQNVFWEAQNETLTVKALAAGDVRIRLNNPKKAPQLISLTLVEPAPVAIIENRVTSQITPPSDSTAASPTNPELPSTPSAPSTPNVGVPVSPPTTGLDPSVINPPIIAPPTPTSSNTSEMAPDNSVSGTVNSSSSLSTDLTSPATPAPNAPALPALTPPVIKSPRRTATKAPAAPQISPILPAPSRGMKAKVDYRTAAKLPTGVSATGKQSIAVTQGLARLLSFPSNILAVFFSDPNVMDARAINARTIAVTGVGPGPSTLAVFTQQFPGDAIGRANIYRIQTTPAGGQTVVEASDPRVIETAIASAIGDPRIRTSVITLRDGSLAARLSGTVRNPAEVSAAVTTAGFYVPKVIPSLYADLNAPTLDAVLSSGYNVSPEEGLQDKLRQISGNQSIELVPLPSGLGFKAEVDSAEEADGLLRLLPTLNQQVFPFIVVHGQTGYVNSTIPVLNGEDRQLTQKLQDVTGIRTVYAVRASGNSLACYGNVRTRSEYDSVRRYMMIAAQNSAPPAVQGTSQGGQTLRPQGNEGEVQAAYNPTAGYRQNLGIQMFVKITDPGQSAIRKVTVETSVVEITHTAAKRLGATYGSVNVTNETPGQTAIVNGVAVTTAAQRTIDTTLNQGTALAGNGFVGGGPFSYINPFRVQLDALVSSGEARILSQPNVTSIEGSPAQITIGGERPVPKVVATQGAVGTQVEFRRYGVIISMRPTVTGDNTILLQIRADITSPDRTYEINLNGALIPGETVRSIDTVLNVKPGDTIVMGGLMTNTNRQNTTKLPVLGDLPIIGSLFRSRNFQNDITELAVFMTPHIEFMPAESGTIEDMNAIPSYPALPGREGASSILFQDTTRQAN